MGILQPVSGADDRLGSFASFPRCPSYVRLCSKTGDKADIARGRICAHFRTHAPLVWARAGSVSYLISHALSSVRAYCLCPV